MSLQPFKLPVLRGIGLSIGVALLLGNTSLIAAAQTRSDSSPDSRGDYSTSPPVVVDTVPTGRSTTRSTIPTSTDDSSPVPTRRSTTPTSTDNSSIPTSESGTRFSCQSVNGQYTVMYHPQSQPNQSFPWAIPSTLGDGWNSERRCNEISQRLESYRPDGLQELRTAVVNNYNTICVTTQENPSCRIVLTVPPGQDPVSTRDRVFQNLTTADSGQQTEGVNTFAGGQPTNEIGQLYNLGRTALGGGNNRRVASNSIQLRPFLDRADGGTGTRLQGGVATQTSPRLNPKNFR